MVSEQTYLWLQILYHLFDDCPIRVPLFLIDHGYVAGEVTLSTRFLVLGRRLPMSECGNDFPFFSNLPNKDGPCLCILAVISLACGTYETDSHCKLEHTQRNPETPREHPSE
jgi:hypothetical protein